MVVIPIMRPITRPRKVMSSIAEISRMASGQVSGVRIGSTQCGALYKQRYVLTANVKFTPLFELELLMQLDSLKNQIMLLENARV